MTTMKWKDAAKGIGVLFVVFIGCLVRLYLDKTAEKMPPPPMMEAQRDEHLFPEKGLFVQPQPPEILF